MMIPQLLFAMSPDEKEAVCSVALVPTFDPVAPQDIFKLAKDEKPESTKLSDGKEFHFIFLVDRSGSMGMNNRMPIARDALTLFMRSLPEGSTFSVISFGTSHAPHSNVAPF